MYPFTSTHTVHLSDDRTCRDDGSPRHPMTRARARREASGDYFYAFFSDAYRGENVGPEFEPEVDDTELTDEWLCVLLYDSGYAAHSPVPVFFADYATVWNMYNLLQDRPLAWMFSMAGYTRPRGNPPHGRIYPVLVALPPNAYAVAQVNMVFVLHAMKSPGVWHPKLCDAMGIERITRKSATFKGSVMNGELVPTRLSDREPILRPARRRRA